MVFATIQSSQAVQRCEQNDKLYKWWQNCQKELRLYIYEDKCPYLCVHVTSTAIEQQTMKTTICSARLSTRQLYARGSEKYKWPWGLKSVATCSDIHFINLLNDGTVSTTNKQNSKHLSHLQSWIRNFSTVFFQSRSDSRVSVVSSFVRPFVHL